MLAKRRLFGALLFMLTLLSSAACAKLNLKPYEVPSASGTEVEILAPEVYLLLHDSSLNGGKLKTALENTSPCFGWIWTQEGTSLPEISAISPPAPRICTASNSIRSATHTWSLKITSTPSPSSPLTLCLSATIRG